MRSCHVLALRSADRTRSDCRYRWPSGATYTPVRGLYLAVATEGPTLDPLVLNELGAAVGEPGGGGRTSVGAGFSGGGGGAPGASSGAKEPNGEGFPGSAGPPDGGRAAAPSGTPAGAGTAPSFGDSPSAGGGNGRLPAIYNGGG